MTFPEFKAWLEGFMHGKEAPSDEEWEMIDDKLHSVLTKTELARKASDDDRGAQRTFGGPLKMSDEQITSAMMDAVLELREDATVDGIGETIINAFDDIDQDYWQIVTPPLAKPGTFQLEVLRDVRAFLITVEEMGEPCLTANA